MVNKNKTSYKNFIQFLCIGIFLSFSINGQTVSNSDFSSSSSFQALNLINVTIGGDFPISGTYPASRTERVDQLLTRILVEYRSELLKTTPDEQLLSLLKQNSDEFSKRNISLKRFNGEIIKIDLVKFRLTGNFDFNPYLNNDDVLIFPPLDLERNFINISGAVNKETKFEFVEGERLSDAILIAQGVNPAYENVDSVLISRLSYDGLNEDAIYLSISDNPILERGDRVIVLSDENKKRDYSVLVLGEVNRPGKIFITKNNTTLKEVIKKAGGFTKNASLKFSEVLRDYNSLSILQKHAIEKTSNLNPGFEEESKLSENFKDLEYLKMYRAANLIMGDTLFFGIDNKLRSASGFASLDFRNLENDSSYESTYRLFDNDVIIVPKKEEEVYVWGGVSKIGYYKYKIENSAWDYIEQAGGLTDIAYGEDEIFLIKGKSRDWIRIENDKLNIEAGDFIYVKKDVPRDTGFYISRVAAYASIIGSIATVVLLLNQIGK